jgi:hypothetical protein
MSVQFGIDASSFQGNVNWARSLLTSVATFCSAAAGGLASHRTSTIRSTGNERGPFHSKQLQHCPGFAAANPPFGQLGTASGDPELADET